MMNKKNMNKNNIGELLFRKTINLEEFYYIITLSQNIAFEQGYVYRNYQPGIVIKDSARG